MVECKEKLFCLIEILQNIDAILDLLLEFREKRKMLEEMELIPYYEDNIDYDNEQIEKCARKVKKESYDEIKLLIEENFSDFKVEIKNR